MEKITFPTKGFPNEEKVYKSEWLRMAGKRPRPLFFVTDQVHAPQTLFLVSLLHHIGAWLTVVYSYVGIKMLTPAGFLLLLLLPLPPLPLLSPCVRILLASFTTTKLESLPSGFLSLWSSDFSLSALVAFPSPLSRMTCSVNDVVFEVEKLRDFFFYYSNATIV